VYGLDQRSMLATKINLLSMCRSARNSGCPASISATPNRPGFGTIAFTSLAVELPVSGTSRLKFRRHGTSVGAGDQYEGDR